MSTWSSRWVLHVGATQRQPHLFEGHKSLRERFSKAQSRRQTYYIPTHCLAPWNLINYSGRQIIIIWGKMSSNEVIWGDLSSNELIWCFWKKIIWGDLSSNEVIWAQLRSNDFEPSIRYYLRIFEEKGDLLQINGILKTWYFLMENWF
jgi:hypothetical protein